MRARAKAQECAEKGDHVGKSRWLREARLCEDQLQRKRQQQSEEASIRFNEINLFGGISGVELQSKDYQIAKGISLRTVFAHVMAPYILAFARAPAGQPHPGPWRAASGGLGFDVTVQLAIPTNCRPTGFDRLNTIWWTVSLLRLNHATGIRLPVIADTDFSEAAGGPSDPVFWPMEVAPIIIPFDGPSSVQFIPRTTLDWIRDNFVSGASLMEDCRFNAAFRALDSSHHATSLSAAMILIWSALEALFRPGRRSVTHRLSLAVATFLRDDPGERDQLYQRSRALYALRGQITHAAEAAEFGCVCESFDLARNCFLRTIEQGKIPDITSLSEQWRARI